MALSPPEMAATKATRILIVEDEGISAGHIVSLLAKAGYEVIGVAETSDDALVKIAELKPELILMDVAISGTIDGIETAVRVRERFDIPLIFLTDSRSGQSLDRARMACPAGFLTRPVHRFNLATFIEMAIQKHRADREVRYQRALMTTVLGTMADAVAVIDGERKIQFLNRRAEELTGWTRDDACGLDIVQVLPMVESGAGSLPNQVLSPQSNPFGPCKIPHGLAVSTRSGTQFRVEGEIAPGVDSGKIVGAVITFREVLSRQGKESQFQQRDNMQAVGRLAAGIAHDFNNLLFIILGYTDELLHTPGLPECGLEALTAIRSAGESATRITEQLLKFSRRDSTTRNEVNLNEVIRESEETLGHFTGPSIKWQFKLDQNLGSVRADHGELKQILLNLAANARDAITPEGGRITVETLNVELPGIEAKKPFVALRFSDSGAGMTAQTAEHLFEPFYTTKRLGKGTGLGLTIVYSIVADLGGTVHVDSEPGRGATFTIYFPRAGSGAPMPAQPGLNTILLADDQEGVRSLLRSYLVDSGYTVLEAEDGEEAIRIAKEHTSPIDLLITDVVMPRASGFDVARALSEKSAMKVMFISGHAQDFADGLEHLPAGARFLSKPFKRTDFLKTVSDLLGTENRHTLKSSA